MFRSYGLQTHIWNNRLKSVLLLIGFPFLLLLITFGFALVWSAFDNPDVGEGILNAIELVPALLPVAIVGSLIWFVIAWFANRWIIDKITGAKPVERKDEPRLYNLLENLCISRGIPMPALRIIPDDALNAFASGVRKSQYSITVTRGLMEKLDDAELQAVLGHELTHIRNRDVQLLVICAVFVGVISLAADLVIRSPRILFYGGGSGRSSSRSSSSGGSRKGGGGAIVLILIAIAIFIIARLLAMALRMAVSRKREFLADAGSVELTQNPDAMISALRRIEGHSTMTVPAQVKPMFIDLPRETGFSGFFATHPPIEARVKALIQFAGGHDFHLPTEAPADAPPTPGPWEGAGTTETETKPGA